MTGVHAWGEEGEEKHPPVGKEINRPKCPNNQPPCHEVFDSCCTLQGKNYGLFAKKVRTFFLT